MKIYVKKYNYMTNSSFFNYSNTFLKKDLCFDSSDKRTPLVKTKIIKNMMLIRVKNLITGDIIIIKEVFPT